MPEKTKNNLTIRHATAKDWDKILPLFEQLYHGDIGPDLRKVFVHFTRDKESLVLIAEQNKKPVGTLVSNYYTDIDWEGKTAKLQAIIVDKKHRNKKIGKKLLQNLLTEAKKHNCKAITSRVNRKNKTARLFHEKLNFEKTQTNEYILQL
jgi:ribosomal protein S18 acetylase RimI-like enzyme